VANKERHQERRLQESSNIHDYGGSLANNPHGCVLQQKKAIGKLSPFLFSPLKKGAGGLSLLLLFSSLLVILLSCLLQSCKKAGSSPTPPGTTDTTTTQKFYQTDTAWQPCNTTGTIIDPATPDTIIYLLQVFFPNPQQFRADNGTPAGLPAYNAQHTTQSGYKVWGPPYGIIDWYAK